MYAHTGVGKSTPKGFGVVVRSHPTDSRRPLRQGTPPLSRPLPFGQGRSYLIFSEVARNRIWRWEEGAGLLPVGRSLYLSKSGCRASDDCAALASPGSTALLRQLGEEVVLMCEHGARRIARHERNGTKTAVATADALGRRLNGPNDAAFTPDGHLYFTDPPRGLQLREDSGSDGRTREIPFNGIWRVPRSELAAAAAGQRGRAAGGGGFGGSFGGGGSGSGAIATIDEAAAAEGADAGATPTRIEAVETALAMPEGLAFSPKFDRLYVANADPSAPGWRVYNVTEDGAILGGKADPESAAAAAKADGAAAAAEATEATEAANEDADPDAEPEPDLRAVAAAAYPEGGGVAFADASPWVKGGHAGLPNGLRVDSDGNVWASGPGGVHVFSAAGRHLGRVHLGAGVAASDVELGNDGYLYITTDSMVARVAVHAKALPVPDLRKGAE